MPERHLCQPEQPGIRPATPAVPSVEGVVGNLTSEAITFSEIKGADAVDWVGSACSRLSEGTVALRPGDQVKVRRFSLARTAILSSIAGLIALSIGQADVGY